MNKRLNLILTAIIISLCAYLYIDGPAYAAEMKISDTTAELYQSEYVAATDTVAVTNESNDAETKPDNKVAANKTTTATAKAANGIAFANKTNKSATKATSNLFQKRSASSESRVNNNGTPAETTVKAAPETSLKDTDDKDSQAEDITAKVIDPKQSVPDANPSSTDETPDINTTEDVEDDASAEDEEWDWSQYEKYGDDRMYPDYIGRLYIPDVDIDVALYDEITYYAQPITDRWDSAVCCEFGGFSGLVIPDHWHQEFYSLPEVCPDMLAYIIYENGSYITLRCDDILDGHNTGEVLTDNDYNIVQGTCDYLMYTCIDGWRNIRLTRWSVIDNEDDLPLSVERAYSVMHDLLHIF